MNSLEELQTRAVADAGDRDNDGINSPEWYEGRSHGVTATEVAKLAKNGAAFKRELIAAKKAGGMGTDLSHVKYVRWGQIREAAIGQWIFERWNITLNQTLFRGLNPRHLATPDGVGQDFDENILVSETKTSKHDLDPADAEGYFWETLYHDQIQWQMWVTGAKRCLFVWEQHDDDWSRWPEFGPTPLYDEPKFIWIERSEGRIKQLVKIADAFLVALDKELPTPVIQAVDPVIDILAQEVLSARADEATVKRRKDEAWGNLLVQLKAKGKDFSQTASSRVTYSMAVTTETTEEDDLAAAEANPDLFTAYTKAKSEWDSHRANYTKPGTKTTPAKLTVTLPQEGK